MENMLYFIELDESKEFSDYDKLMNLLSAEKKTQVHKFRFDIDKKLSLLSHLFVRYLACSMLNIDNTDLNFSTNGFGKPFLNGHPNFQYNISHTRNAIVIGISEKTIGVDIEKIKPTNLKIAERFFCKNELTYILSKKELQDRLFYEIWTKKEAYIKWIGKGLSIPLNSFDVTDLEIAVNFKIFRMNEYIFSVCCKDNVAIPEPIILNENEARKMLLKFDQLGISSVNIKKNGNNLKYKN